MGRCGPAPLPLPAGYPVLLAGRGAFWAWASKAFPAASAAMASALARLARAAPASAASVASAATARRRAASASASSTRRQAAWTSVSLRRSRRRIVAVPRIFWARFPTSPRQYKY